MRERNEEREVDELIENVTNFERHNNLERGNLSGNNNII